MSQPPIKKRRQLVTDTIRRIVTYTTEINFFGTNSVGLALAEAIGGAASGTYQLYRATLRRITLLASSDDFLTDVANEKGAVRLGAQQSRMLVIVQPHTAVVTAITSGGTDLIEVDDSSQFPVAASIRIRSQDGTTSETATIIAVTSATGPNGGDELEVATLVNPYAPLIEDVRVLLRHVVPVGSLISTTAGVTFETLETVITGDANPVMDGEGTFLGLADKVQCEAQEAGATGDVDPLTATAFVPAIPEVKAIFNPEAGAGGGARETDFDLKFRASHGPTRAGQETAAWVEQIARDGDSDVLRAIVTNTAAISTMAFKALHRNGGPLPAGQATALEAYIGQRVRSFMLVDAQDIVLTAVEVYAQITLDTDADFRTVWRDAANRLATSLDYRKRPFGQSVDEAALLTIVQQTSGIAGVVTSTFQPSTNVSVGDESLPVLVRLTLENLATNEILNAELQVGF